MARGPMTFRQRDLTRAVRGVRAAGLEVGRVEIDKTGKIIVFAGTEASEGASRLELNEWDAMK